MLYNPDATNATLPAQQNPAEYEYIENLAKVKNDFITNRSGTTIVKEKNQDEHYMAYVPLNTNDWYIVTLVPSVVAQASGKEMMFFVAALLLTLAVTIGFMVATFFKLRRRNREERYALAFQDGLTKSRNKAKLLLDMQQISSLYDGHYYLLVYDIKNFASYNEIFGYDNGDELIKAINEVIKANVGSGELFARSYAERFILLLHAASNQELEGRIKCIFQGIAEYLQRSNKSGYNLISRFGIYRIESEDTELSMDIFIDYANRASQQISDIYKSSYYYFNLAQHNENNLQVKIESHMYAALNQREFQAFLQPQYTILGDKPVLCGAECLVRWKYEGTTMLSPDKFIPTFEQNGFVIELDMYMLEEACKALRRWLDEGKQVVPLSVNQSRLHMFNPQYLQKILQITDKYNIPHHLLDFEITESAVMNDVGQVQQQFKQLRGQGFLTSMDDFGSGFSSLNLLKNIEADTIKIDKGFFDEAFASEDGKFIVSSVIKLVKQLGFGVIAEGIETSEQVEYLIQCNCDRVQGYYFGKPVPLEVFEQQHLSKLQQQ